jgi:hypothetical protein
MGSGLLGTPGDEGVGDGLVGPDMSKATTVLLIKNMLSDAELGDENECKEIAEDTIEKVRACGSKGVVGGGGGEEASGDCRRYPPGGLPCRVASAG